MKKLIPIKLFYSAQGYNEKNIQISYSNGMLDEDEMLDVNGSILKIMVEYNKDVKAIQVISATPLEFIEVELQND